MIHHADLLISWGTVLCINLADVVVVSNCFLMYKAKGIYSMKTLFVVAHPDDEVLGAGATINKLVQEGHKVAVATLASHADARVNLSETLASDQKRAFSVLGIHKSYVGDFPNIKMNAVPHLHLVQFIESCIEDWGAESIYTHHPADTNNDHVVTSYAAQAASRLFQRKPSIPKLKQFIYMEVPSSTEWSFDSSANRFSPNMFVEVGKEGIDIKLKALAEYTGVMRPYPHPRSEDAIAGLAAYRGVQSGCNYAEAFESVFFRT